MVSPISCVAHFALCLLSFLLILRYVPYLNFISFLIFCLFEFLFSFPFARLGALLESSVKSLGVLPPVGTYPPIGGFIFGSGGLGLVLGDLYPLLYKSQVWFKSVREVLRREVMGSDLGLGDLERGASSNLGGEGTGADTATSAPSSTAVVRTFHALKEKCSLKVEVLASSKIGFNFLRGSGLVSLGRTRGLVPLHMEKFAFMRLRFRAASGFPSIPSS